MKSINNNEKKEINILDNFSNLAPVSDGKNQEVYIKLLQKGIKDKDVKNIALTGSYGSGKSSILKRLLSELPTKEKNKYLEISLANFDKESKNEEKEQLIERSILQQIFYKVSKNKLPYSKLNRTENKNSVKLWMFTALFFIWIVSLLIYKNRDSIHNIFHIYNINNQTIFLQGSIIAFLGTTFFIIYLILKGTGKIKLNKLSFQGINLDIEENKEGSLLNQYIDEILYFFEATEYEVVIIEDLDRYEVTNIFQKLREINILLNSYEEIKGKKKITFIYAVKDSIFTGEERTKFFEMVIPVIPIVNTNNAKDILINKFSDAGLLDKIGKPFLKDISYYIKDLRQLTNIFNEYLVYHKSIDTKNQKELFSMIVYKNFFPKDFALLHNREGELYRILTKGIEQLREKELKQLTEQRDALQKNIEEVENEKLESIEELKLLFLSKILVQHSDLQSFWYQNSRFSAAELIENEDAFKAYLEGGDLKYYYFNTSYTTKGTFKNIYGDYMNRLKIIENKIEEKKGSFTKELHKIQQHIRETKYAKIAELLTDDLSVLDIANENWSDEEKSNWKLIKHLIKNGYINEKYKTYISYFHEGVLTRNDHDFVVAIKENEPKDFRYELDNIGSVIDELDKRDFESQNIENIDIAQYFFSNKIEYKAKDIDKYMDKKKIFISHIFENQNQEFIFNLLEKNIKNIGFLSSFVSEVISDQNIKLVDIVNILKGDILLLQELLIFLMDNLTKFELSEDDKKIIGVLLKENIIDIYDKLEQKDIAKELLVEQNIKFDEFDKKLIKLTSLFDYIYKHNLYKFSIENIKTIMETISGKDEWDRDLFYKAHLTTVRKNDLTFMVEYIDDNINEYYASVMNELTDNSLESEETLLYLLNNDALSDTYKNDIIQKSKNKITDILDIDDKDLWDKLFADNLIVATWDNVFNYYIEKKELDEPLFNFLNNIENAKELSRIRVDKDYFEEHQDFVDNGVNNLLREILESDEFKDEIYRILIKNYGYWYSNLDLSSLTENKINILIDTGRLQPKEEMYDAIEEKCIQCAIRFIERYKQEYLEDEFSAKLNSEVFIGLLKSDKLTKEDKILLIDKNSNFDFDELKEIVKFYMDEKEKIPKKIFNELYYDSSFDNQNRISILAYNIEQFGFDEVLGYLDELGSPYSEILERTRKPLRIDFEKNIWTIIQYLSKQRWIGKVNRKENQIIVNRREKDINV